MLICVIISFSFFLSFVVSVVVVVVVVAVWARWWIVAAALVLVVWIWDGFPVERAFVSVVWRKGGCLGGRGGCSDLFVGNVVVSGVVVGRIRWMIVLIVGFFVFLLLVFGVVVWNCGSVGARSCLAFGVFYIVGDAFRYLRVDEVNHFWG